MEEPSKTLPLGLVRTEGISEPSDDAGRRHLLLRQLDRVPAKELYAAARVPHEFLATYATPAKVVGSDGRMYWIKGKAQSGLTVELVTGRLMSRLGAGPNAQMMEVPAIVFRDDPSLGRFRGPLVGIDHLPETVSTREIGQMIGQGIFDPRRIDPMSRALAVAAQTWMNVEDAQVRVGILDGQVYSVDHGIALDARLKGRPTNIVISPIPGISTDIGRSWDVMKRAVELIESITELEILAAVSGIPDAPGWQSGFARRLAIAAWLIKRQRYISLSMREWCGVLS